MLAEVRKEAVWVGSNAAPNLAATRYRGNIIT